MARRTFHDLIRANKRNSIILMSGMTLLLLFLGYLLGFVWGDQEMGIGIAVITAILVLLISWGMGSSMVMAFAGAMPIEKEMAPQLFNIVEEMAIAAGVPMPKVYIIHEAAPNAFATGISPESASVAVTTGLLEKLNREQLQGVIAHEIGHIRNFDIRFSLLMAVMAGGIVILSDMVWRSALLTGGRRRSDRDNGGQIVVVILGLALAVLAPLAAAIIQMAVSREREYLADASAVEFTRNPNGLAEALAILAGDRSPMPECKATENMYIVNPKLGLRGGADSLFSTHPPIEERIERLRNLM
ncbi:MAG: M48 family metallopeptidase [Lentisphaeria bacterium]|nr:M48 family metallopeptidase [Lentisphaeria bacterium]